MGLASNEKLQRMTQLERAIEWHEEQRKANAARGAAPAAPVVKVKNLGALRVRGSGRKSLRPARVWTRGWASEDRKTRCTITPRSIPRVVPRRVNPKSIRRTRGRTTTTASRGEDGRQRGRWVGVPGEPCVVPAADAEDAGILPPPPGPPPSVAPPKDLLRGRLRGRPQARPRAPRPGPRLAPRLGRLRGLLPALLRSFRRPGLLPGLPGLGRASRATASRTASRRAHRRGGR